MKKLRYLEELKEAQLARVREFQVQAQQMGQERAEQAQQLAREARRQYEQSSALNRHREEERALRMEMLDQERRAREETLRRELRKRAEWSDQERLARLEEREQERALRADESRRRAQELAVRMRERSPEIRARLRERLRDAQQVVVRVRARARLGVSLDGTQGDEFDRQGARIMDVSEDSPAEGAGLREGDIITHLDGVSLVDPLSDEDEMDFGEETSLPVQRLMALARGLEDGQEVEVRYLRDGSSETVTLEAAKLENSWVSVSPGQGRRGVYRFGPEEGLRWRYSIPGEDFHVEVLPHLEDLDIELSDFDFEEFDFDTIKGFNILKGEGPNFRFFRGEEGPNISFFRDEDSPNLALYRGENDFAFSFFDGHLHGVELHDLNPELGAYFSTEQGVLVLEVEEESTLGLRPGDVILSVGDRGVEDSSDVLRILRSYEDEEAVSFTVMRQGQETRVNGTVR